jgi:type II secretory pathway component PulK
MMAAFTRQRLLWEMPSNIVRRKKNDRGVALLIVLLVTALLVALIFEFAYGTRVSMRAAANFRDSQRAYFLARSAFGVFAKFPELRDYIKQDERGDVPIESGGDTALRLRWEDEAGKIYIKGLLPGSQPYKWLRELFRIRVVNQEIIDKIADINNPPLQLVTDLHRYMGDEDYDKVARFVTVYSNMQKININTAPEEVLSSVLAAGGITSITLSSILLNREEKPYTASDLTGIAFSDFIATSTIFKVYSFAKAGGYEKQIEAVIDLNNSKTPLYWRAI